MDKTSTHSLDDTLALMRDLRKRCEWDAAQTHESLRPYLIEEAHELDDAIRLENDKLLREELGDLLLQVLFHSVLAEERGAFVRSPSSALRFYANMLKLADDVRPGFGNDDLMKLAIWPAYRRIREYVEANKFCA